MNYETVRSFRDMRKHTKVAVIGGGNIGTQVACVCAAKGYSVCVYTSKPELYDGVLEIADEAGNVTKGKIDKATPEIGEAVRDCDIILVCHPAFMLSDTARKILPYIRPGMQICVFPGTGGAEFAFHECALAGAILNGLQRVPSVARLEQYGKRVRCEGLRGELFLASVPKDKGGEMADFLSSLWGIPCAVLPNYLNVTLTPSNPILHTTRLRTLFSDYEPGRVYDRNPLFYGEWSDASSKLLLACDDELQRMCGALDKLDLCAVRSLKIHYESNSVQEMTSKLSSIRSLHSIASPMRRVKDGWIPDFQSRYFTADFPYGLAILEDLARLLRVDVPNIETTMQWYRRVTRKENQFRFADYGIIDKDALYDFYDS